MRIYEVRKHLHIDLDKIVSIRQFIDRRKKANRSSTSTFFEYWIEVTIDSGSFVTVECDSDEDLVNTYNSLLSAWRQYVGDPSDYDDDLMSGFQIID